MEGEVTSELDGLTDTTATEAVNESGEAKAKVVGRADDNRGDRRGTETENGRDSDVADNEPRYTTEAMHRKEGPNIKLNNNKRPRCTDKKENNQRSQPTEGAQNKHSVKFRRKKTTPIFLHRLRQHAKRAARWRESDCVLDCHGGRGWSPGGRMPGRDAHGQGRRTPGGRHG